MGDDEQPVINTMSSAASRPPLVDWVNVEVEVLVVVLGAGAMVTAFSNVIYGLIFMVVGLIACRVITAIDDSAFRLIWLWLQMRLLQVGSGWKTTKFQSNKSRI